MLEACYVLQRRPYKDTSLLLDVFSHQHGKIGLIAKGAYKAKSVKSAQLQPFQPLLLDWVGRSDLKTLTKLEAPSPALEFTGSTVYGAMYINELLYRTLPPAEPNFSIFEAYVGSLGYLSEGHDLIEVLRDFEFTLLSEIGLLPDFSADWYGNEIREDYHYYLSEEYSFVIADSDMQGSTGVFSGRLISELADKRNSKSIQDGISEPSHLRYNASSSGSHYAGLSRLMRYLVNNAVGGAELHSRKLIKSLSNNAR